MLLTDRDIHRLYENGLMTGYEPWSVKLTDDGQPVVSYGRTSYGYDLRLASLSIPVGEDYWCIDVKDDFSLAAQNWTPAEVSEPNRYIIPPNTFALGVVKERLRMPENVCGIIYGKSTYARCGLMVIATPVEPGWEGYLTIGLYNTRNLPLVVYKDEGIVQIQFHRSSERPTVIYRDRQGKYQGQDNSITLPRM